MKKCPICAINLQIAQKQGIEIDFCPQCQGVWLDRGELQKIIERSVGIAAEPTTPASSSPTRSGRIAQPRPGRIQQPKPQFGEIRLDPPEAGPPLPRRNVSRLRRQPERDEPPRENRRDDERGNRLSGFFEDLFDMF